MGNSIGVEKVIVDHIVWPAAFWMTKMAHCVLLLSAMIEFLAQRLKRGMRKNCFDRESKKFTDPESEFETGIVFATFEVPNRLVVNTQRLGEVLA